MVGSQSSYASLRLAAWPSSPPAYQTPFVVSRSADSCYPFWFIERGHVRSRELMPRLKHSRRAHDRDIRKARCRHRRQARTGWNVTGNLDDEPDCAARSASCSTTTRHINPLRTWHITCRVREACQTALGAPGSVLLAGGRGQPRGRQVKQFRHYPCLGWPGLVGRDSISSHRLR
jgi:hypothetical protein